MEAKPLDEIVTFRLSTQMYRKLAEVASRDNRRKADMARILFIKGLEVYEREPKGKR